MCRWHRKVNSSRVWPSLKLKNKNSLQKVQEERYPWPLGQHLHPKASSITMPCIATLGWHPAQPAKHTETQGSAGIDSSKASTISMVCSTGRKSGGGDLYGDVCASLLHSFLEGEEDSQAGCLPGSQAPRTVSLGSGAVSLQAHSLSFAGWKGEVASGSVPERSRWWNVLKHICNKWRKKWINIKSKENRKHFSYQLYHSWGGTDFPLGNPQYLRDTGKIWNGAENLFRLKPLRELVTEISPVEQSQGKQKTVDKTLQKTLGINCSRELQCSWGLNSMELQYHF